jgi:MazG family protein
MPQVPPEKLNHLDSLIQVVHTLRQHCPWDKEQTFESLKPYILEESQELHETLSTPIDPNHLKEELGDVLLHVIMLSELAQEKGWFDAKDVIQGICEKMIRRHPHVYADVQINSIEELKANWKKIKNAEKNG